MLALIVDDNEQNLKLASDVLRASGFETIAARTGAEGIAVAQDRTPDVVLLDLQLGDMDGTVVARELRADTRTARLPLVLMSATRIDEADWLEASGFTGSISKPIDVAAFPEQVRAFAGASTR